MFQIIIGVVCAVLGGMLCAVPVGLSINAGLGPIYSLPVAFLTLVGFALSAYIFGP